MLKKIIIAGLAGVAILAVGIFAYVHYPNSDPPSLPAVQTEQRDVLAGLEIDENKSAETPPTPKIVTTPQTVSAKQDAQQVTGYWVQDQYGWRAVGTPPQCPEPLELA